MDKEELQTTKGQLSEAFKGTNTPLFSTERNNHSVVSMEDIDLFKSFEQKLQEAIDGRISRTSMAVMGAVREIRAKRDRFMQLLLTIPTFAEAMQAALDFADALKSSATRFRQAQEHALDDLSEFDVSIDKAKAAVAQSNFKRGANGEFDCVELNTIVLLSLSYYQLPMDTLEGLSDADAAELAKRVIKDSDAIKADLQEEFELSGKVADILETAEQGLSKRIEDIKNDPRLTEQEKTQALTEALENVELSIINDLKHAGLDDIQLKEVFDGLNKENTKTMNNTKAVVTLDAFDM